MTASQVSGKLRSVVPRWRSFLNTPTIETTPLKLFTDHPPILRDQFEDVLKLWRISAQPHDFVDIMDAGIACGDRRIAAEGARRIMANKALFQDRVIEQAFQIIENKTKYVPHSRTPIDEQNVEHLRAKIARMKIVVRDSPRNSLGHVEIARLYARLGQFDKAEEHLDAAIAISPDDRFVLRALTRFYTMLDEPTEALRRLWATPAIVGDPWIQSAELAAALLAKRGTRHAHKVGKYAVRNRITSRELSELTAGWLTKQFEEGVASRVVVRSLAPALVSPTENALAQGVWLVDHMGREFRQSFPSVNFEPDAHEAKAMALEEEEKYVEAEGHMRKWFIDQPFQARSSICLSHLYFAYLQKYEEALDIAQQGLILHPNEWSLHNTAVISSCMLGKIDRAYQHLKNLERFQGGEVECYISAARGMIDFQKGDFDSGYENYLEAARLSKIRKSPDLVLLSFLYLIEMMVRTANVGSNMAHSVLKDIEYHIGKLPGDDLKRMRRILNSRRQVIDQIYDDRRGLDIMEQLNVSRMKARLLEHFDDQ